MSTGPNPIPAGLELSYELEKDKILNPLDAFVLTLHWSVIRTGLRQRKSDGGEFTERLPENWSQRAEGEADGAPRTLTLTYHDPKAPQIKYELRVIELTPNAMVAVTFFRSPATNSGNNSSTPAGKMTSSETTTAAATANRPASQMRSGTDKNSAAATFQIENFVMSSAFEEGKQRDKAKDVYEHADLLETQLYESIMEPLGLRVLGQPPVPGPYDDKTKTEQPVSQQPSRQPINPLQDDRFFHPEMGRQPPMNPGIPMGPLGIPPIGGPGGLGHSDLDPLGRFGAGNILDPRGFRNPRGGMMPGFPGPGIPGPPPGARFDPYGPPNPARPNPSGLGGNFGFPNPDHERPGSDYDDMFM